MDGPWHLKHYCFKCYTRLAPERSHLQLFIIRQIKTNGRSSDISRWGWILRRAFATTRHRSKIFLSDHFHVYSVLTFCLASSGKKLMRCVCMVFIYQSWSCVNYFVLIFLAFFCRFQPEQKASQNGLKTVLWNRNWMCDKNKYDFYYVDSLETFQPSKNQLDSIRRSQLIYSLCVYFETVNKFIEILNFRRFMNFSSPLPKLSSHSNFN